jgi:tripartite-type tricarboxylate transporter receptor subunit TctC
MNGSAPGLTAIAALTAALWGLAPQGFAQSYPARPVRIIVPFSAGGPADLLARVIGEKLQRGLGQSIVVLNKDGAGTILGVDMAAKSSPDGYTLLLGSTAMVINSSTGKKLPYDMLKDLTPVTLAFTQPLILVLQPSVPVNSVKELVAFAKSNPGKLKYGSSGVGTSIHLTTELFRSAVGIDMTHVPYKGVAPALTDLLGGQIDLMFPGITPAMPHIKSGKLKALALTSRTRSQALPEMPTLIELGVANFESVGWYGVLVPAGTPKAIAARLNTELVKVLTMQDVKENLARQGGEATSSTPERFATFIGEELKKWTKVIRSANIKVE